MLRSRYPRPWLVAGTALLLSLLPAMAQQRVVVGASEAVTTRLRITNEQTGAAGQRLAHRSSARSPDAAVTVRVGIHPIAVAVDQGTAHVFVANQGIMTATGPISASLSMLDATTGALQRTIPMSEAPIGLAVDNQTNHVFVITEPSNPGKYSVLMLDGHSGHLLYAARAVSDGLMAMLVAERAGRLFIEDVHGVTAFDSYTGHLLDLPLMGVVHGGWHEGCCPAPNTVPTLHGDLAIDDSNEHLLVANGCGNPYVDGCLAIYSAATGNQLATPQMAGPVNDLAVDAHAGRAVVGAGNRGGASTWITLVNSHTMKVLRYENLTTHAELPPILTIGTDARTGHAVLVATWDAYTADYGSSGGEADILLLDTRTGHVLNRVNSSAGGNRYPPTTQIVVDERTSRAFVLGDAVPGDGPGQVLTVDTRTGDVIGSIDVSPNSTGLALDEQTSRVFVTHSTKNTVSVIDAG